MAKKMKFAVLFDIDGQPHRIEDFKVFADAKKWANTYDGYVYLQDPAFGITDRIYPKPYYSVGWQDINNMLCNVFVNNLHEPVFKYIVTTYSCSPDGEGYEGDVVVYKGTDRKQAFNAYKSEPKEWTSVEMIVLGREKEHSERKEAEKRMLELAFEDEFTEWCYKPTCKGCNNIGCPAYPFG